MCCKKLPSQMGRNRAGVMLVLHSCISPMLFAEWEDPSARGANNNKEVNS